MKNKLLYERKRKKKIDTGPGCVVTTTMCHDSDDVYELKLKTSTKQIETLKVTGLHPFFDAKRRVWVQVNQLSVGMVLTTLKGQCVVEKIRKINRVFQVFNFTVENEHVYYVSKSAILVHNDCDGDKLPNDAEVIRGGQNTPEAIRKGTGTHPEGVTGVSVESGPGLTVPELAEIAHGSGALPHSRIGTTTVGHVRNAGGDVIKTSGRSPNHATMTGLPDDVASKLLNPTIPNPAKTK